MNATQIPEITTEYTEIRRDGEYVATVSTSSTLAWFHQNCRAYSMHHALTHEGYSIHPVEERIVFFTETRNEDGTWNVTSEVKKSKRAADMAMNRYRGEATSYGWRRERKIDNTWIEA